MSKRRSENNYNSKDTNNSGAQLRNKRAKVNEEDEEGNQTDLRIGPGINTHFTGSLDNISAANGHDQNSPDDPCDGLLNLFYKVITDLHKYNEQHPFGKKATDVNEERKANKGAVNHDESVRLQQEPEIEEIERKSNKDKDINKPAVHLPKIEEKYEETKKVEEQNTKYQGNYLPRDTITPSNLNNSDTRNFVAANNEMSHGQTYNSNTYQNRQMTPMKPQNVIDLEEQPEYQQNVPRNINERNLGQHNLNARVQTPQLPMMMGHLQQQMKSQGMPVNPYSRPVQSQMQHPMMGQPTHMDK